MKKIVALLLTFITVLSLMACGSDTTVVEKEIVKEEQYVETEQQLDEITDVKEQEDNKENIPVIPTIEETVILEYEGVTVTAKEYTAESIWGDGIKLLVENNGDKTVGVSCENVIVNDYMLSDFFSTTVAAGKKDNETLYLSSNELEAAGITNIGKVEVQLYLFNSDSYNTIYTGDLVEIQTSEYENMDVTADNVGAELYNENGVRIVGKYVDEDSFWGAAVILYIENNTGRDITVSCEDLSVNGFMVDSWFGCDVVAGKKAVDDITLTSSTMEENDITSIDDIEVVFTAYDSNTYSTIFKSDPITFSVK